MRGIGGGNRTLETSISIVNDVEDFLVNSPQSSTFNCNAHNLQLNTKSLEQYYHHMKHTQMYKPSTLSEKLRQLKLAIKSLIHENHNNTDLSTKGYQIISLLSEWIKSLSKARGKQGQQHGLKVMDKLSAESPTKTTENFLNNKHLLGKVKSAIFNLGFTFESLDIKLLSAYAASVLLYRNSQRLGVIQNLTLTLMAFIHT